MSRSALMLTPSELRNLTARTAHRPTVVQMRDTPIEKERKRQKYGNQKVEDETGLKFDSKAEHRRWCCLVMLAKAREISDLQRQVRFELIPSVERPSGGKERPTVYIADFTYTDRTGRKVVEDVKGAVTPEFRLKRKLMLWVHGIEVKEIRS